MAGGDVGVWVICVKVGHPETIYKVGEVRISHHSLGVNEFCHDCFLC
jgi:hypothetical protein